ncbi:MAG TPA: hypothetical protein PLA41_00450 [Candidatus Pacearchaeota archaeon]|nr:hypothetical protein [Candidatus Parcubacteria bacterium]HOU45607.1 hypothetical protein [Candidatus Pacearchaeota archaeon]HPM08565.1 hypothetical protein [Candidatus Pacearchaeota archaeon]HQI74236.1 hypothetical protein [Candidatus Pacearchaeota archaeon]
MLEEILADALQKIFLILKTWWWIFPPFYFYGVLKNLYLYWANWEFWFPTAKWVTLEIVPPRNLSKTFKSMEDVFCGLWGTLYLPANWREYWLEGSPGGYGGPYWFTLDMCSFGGDIHFFAKMPKGARDNFEATFYSQYPDCEIFETEDYTTRVPQNIPNGDWDVRGEDQMLLKEDFYPIKTYMDFFEPQIGQLNEERMIDPLHSLIEAMANLLPGDQVWMQMGLMPITGSGAGHERLLPYAKEAKVIIDKLLKKKVPPPSQPVWVEFWKNMTDGKVFQEEFLKLIGVMPPKKEEEKKEKEELTQKEREILKAVEDKISKRLFSVWIRTLYIGDKSKPRNAGNFGVTRNYYQHFGGPANGMRFSPHTRTKINYFLRERRLYLRKRKMFRKYVSVWPPTEFVYKQKTPYFVFNVEELATVFHFPAQYSNVNINQVEIKKSEAPTNLPVQ